MMLASRPKADPYVVARLTSDTRAEVEAVPAATPRPNTVMRPMRTLAYAQSIMAAVRPYRVRLPLPVRGSVLQ
jgi:hypothetical protein